MFSSFQVNKQGIPIFAATGKEQNMENSKGKHKNLSFNLHGPISKTLNLNEIHRPGERNRRQRGSLSWTEGGSKGFLMEGEEV